MENKGKKYDELEQLFRSRLGNDKITADNWNTPPDSVLNEALNKLSDERKKRRIAIFYWIFSGVLFLSLLGLLFYSTPNTNRTHQKLDAETSKIQSNIALNEKDNKETDKVITNSELNVQAEQSLSSENDEAGDLSDESSIENNLTQSSPASRSSANEPPRGSINGFDDNNSLNSSEIVLAESELNEVKLDSKFASSTISESSTGELSETSRLVFSLENMPVLDFENFDIYRDKPIASPLYVDDIANTSSSQIGGYFFGSYMLSTFRMTNTENDPFSLTKYDKRYMGYQLGVGLKFQLSERLQLNSSIAYSHSKNKSLYEEQMPYDISKESTNSSGETMYQTGLNIASPTGSYSTNVEFSVTDQNLSQNDLLANKTDISQGINTINLSLGLDYTFANLGHVDFLLSGGIIGNYVSNLNQDMDTEVSSTDKMLMKKSFNSNSKAELKTYYLSYYGNIGMKYNMHNGFFLQLNTGLENSITPLRITDTTIPSKTFLNHLKGQILVGYNF